MASGHRIVLAIFAALLLCVIAGEAGPVYLYWDGEYLEVGQTRTASLRADTSYQYPTDINFTVTCNSAAANITDIVITNTSGVAVQRLDDMTVRFEIATSGGNLGDFADISVKGLSPGNAYLRIDYQGYGYHQGSSYIDMMHDAHSDNRTFRVYRPYAELTAPCRIEAEDYDYGPDGFAYHDTTTGNSGGAYRADDVDISEKPGGGHNVGYVADGEWLTYTVTVPENYPDTHGNANVSLRVASWKDGCQIRISGEYGRTTVTVPNTHDQWVSIEDSVNLWTRGGPETITVEFVGSGMVLDYIELLGEAPDAAFMIGGHQQNPPSTVEFSDNSGNLPTGWNWSFGDGGTSTERSPSHTYTQPGRYSVTLTATNGVGAGTLTKYVYILSAFLATPEKLFTVQAFDPSNPWAYRQSIWEDTVLYDDNGLHLFHLGNGSASEIATSTKAVSFDLSGDWVVWSSGYGYHDFSTPSDVYLYDIRTGQETRLTSSSTASNPSISGDRIVFQDKRNGNYDIFLYNITTRTESMISADPGDQIFPGIDGETVVWQDYRLGHTRMVGYDEYEATSNIYLYSLASGTGRLISTLDTNQEDPQVSGHRVIWEDGRRGRATSDAGHIDYFDDVYMLDTDTNTESALKENYADYSSSSSLTISGDLAAWYNYLDSAVGVVNLKTNQEYEVRDAVSPDVFGTTLVYMVDGDVYMQPVITPGAVPGGSGLPGDLNGDGKFEDVNGNGRRDFADIVLFFNQMAWIPGNEPVTAFDFNDNGRIDFSDVVTLFNGL